MTPCALYFHSRRMKQQNVVCAGRSSISNALGRSVFALVIRLSAQAGRWQRLSKPDMMAYTCHQPSRSSPRLSLHPLDFSPTSSPKQGRINFGDRGIAAL
uniref:Uncharacterized protein n=1 Tax=Arundo donax TaxID=35708 RepID=A0A0A9BXC0_ARUDO